MMLSTTLLTTLLALPLQKAATREAGSPLPPSNEVVAQASGALQSGIRKRLMGRLVQRDGSAWGGASVRLISWPDWNYPGVGTFDDLSATTDARGRFKAMGLQHRRYYVWAWQALDDSRYRISEPGEFIPPGLPFILKEQDRTLRKQIVTVDVESWSRFGPFRIAVRQDPFFGSHYRALSKQLKPLPWILTDLDPGLPPDMPTGQSSNPGGRAEPEVDVARLLRLELPVLPWPRIRVEVLGKGGMLLFKRSLWLQKEGQGLAETRLSPGVPKQEHVRFYLDENLTKRAKGYKLYQRYMGRLVEMGGVDEDGQGRILLPHDPRKIYDNYWYERNPRYVGRLEGRAEASDYNLERMTRVGGGRGMRLRGAMGVLQQNHVLKLLVKSPEGKPLANLPLLVWQRERIPRLLRKVHVLPVTLVKTDAEGRLDYPWLSKEEYAVCAILPDDCLDMLMGSRPEDRKALIHPMVLLHRGLGIDLEKDKTVTLSVASLQKVQFEVAWDREKVREIPVVNVFSPIADNYGYARLLRLFCNRRGRVRALLPRRQQLPFLARSLLGVVEGVVSTEALGEGSIMKVVVRIPDAVEISGQILDARGQPVRSAGLSLANPWFSARYRKALLRFDIARIAVLADEQGRFRFFQEEVRAPLQLYVQAFSNEQSLRRSVHALDVEGNLTGLKIEVAGFEELPAVRRGVPPPKVRRIPVKKR